jgi:hypothetical protein
MGASAPIIEPGKDCEAGESQALNAAAIKIKLQREEGTVMVAGVPPY